MIFCQIPQPADIRHDDVVLTQQIYKRLTYESSILEDRRPCWVGNEGLVD